MPSRPLGVLSTAIAPQAQHCISPPTRESPASGRLLLIQPPGAAQACCRLPMPMMVAVSKAKAHERQAYSAIGIRRIIVIVPIVAVIPRPAVVGARRVVVGSVVVAVAVVVVAAIVMPILDLHCLARCFGRSRMR